MVPDPRGSPPDPSPICFTKAGQPSLAATRPWGGALTQPGEPVLALRRPRAARGPWAGRGRPLGGATWSAVKDLGVREALGAARPNSWPAQFLRIVNQISIPGSVLFNSCDNTQRMPMAA